MALNAGDVMQQSVNTVRAKSTLVDLDRALCEKHQSGFPVVDDTGRLVGVVSRTDVVRKLAAEQSWAEYGSDYYCDLSQGSVSLEPLAAQIGRRLEEASVADVMSRDPVTIERSTSLQELAQVMSERGVHRLPVVDGDELVGIVTTMDVTRLVAEGKIG